MSKRLELKKGSSTNILHPMLHARMLRVGGRLPEEILNSNIEHSVIVPKKLDAK